MNYIEHHILAALRANNPHRKTGAYTDRGYAYTEIYIPDEGWYAIHMTNIDDNLDIQLRQLAIGRNEKLPSDNGLGPQIGYVGLKHLNPEKVANEIVAMIIGESEILK